jgi:hypothetical protein
MRKRNETQHKSARQIVLSNETVQKRARVSVSGFLASKKQKCPNGRKDFKMVHWYMSRLRSYGWICWYVGNGLSTVTDPQGEVYRNQNETNLDGFLTQEEKHLEKMPSVNDWLNGAKSPERIS